jgi:hypothetical protein
MATIGPILSETGPTLEEILSRHGFKEEDLDRECPQDIRDDIAVELGADWEMIGRRCLEFSMDELRATRKCAEYPYWTPGITEKDEEPLS